MDEPIVWMEGRLDRRPHISQTESGPQAMLLVNVMTGFGIRQYSVRADGSEHVGQVGSHHADKGSALILKGVLADHEDDGGDVVAMTLAFDPSRATTAGSEA